MRRAGIPMAAFLVGLAVTAAAASISQFVREQLQLERAVLEREVADFGRHETNVDEAWRRVELLSADLLRAYEQDESLASLRLRDADLRVAEGALVMHVLEAQRLRASVIASRSRVEALVDEVRRLEGDPIPDDDPLSGTWDLKLEPGGQTGTLELTLDGTLVQGTYVLSGGWSGSVRGTLVSGKVRLERIDSQLGFAAIYYGVLTPGRAVSRLEGTWEATQLASGLPSSGSWLAQRFDEVHGDQ